MVDRMNEFDVVGVAGDWHGNTGWALDALRKFKRENITRVLHVGDFGIWPGQDGASFIRKVSSFCVKNNMHIDVAPGNHEDYVRINNTPVHEDGWQYYRENIRLIPRGHRWSWNSVSFVGLGGANSIDFLGRTKNVTWWEEEQITSTDVYNTISEGHADVMISHDCPAGVNPFHPDHIFGGWTNEELTYAKKSSHMLRQAVDGVKPDILFHGHYHNFHDSNVELFDGVEHYKSRVIGLGCDTQENNIGSLSLPDMVFKIIA